jgi:hypothetical protein
MIVRRGPVTGKQRQIFLMHEQLPLKPGILFEQEGGSLPRIEKSPGPHPGEKPNAKLDSARPIDSSKWGVLVPPRFKVGSGSLRILGTARQEVRDPQDGDVVVARDLPNVLRRANRCSITWIQIKGEGGWVGAKSGCGVGVPVRYGGKIRSMYSEG